METTYKKLFAVADDFEASVIQGVMLKCGDLWACPECGATFESFEESCEFCGTTKPNHLQESSR